MNTLTGTRRLKAGTFQSSFIWMRGRALRSGSLVIGSEPTCVNCQIIRKSGEYLLYESF